MGSSLKGWEWKRLGDLVTYKKGRKPDVLCDQKTQGSLPYLTAGYFRTNTPEQFVPEESLSNCVLCDSSDIILIWDGSKAGDVFTGLRGVLSSTMIKIEPNEKQLVKVFCFFFLKTRFHTLNSRTTGSSIPHISRSIFEDLKIFQLPIETQRRMASILEKAEEIKRLGSQASALATQFIQSLFFEMFGDPGKNPKGWRSEQLDSVCTKVTDGEHNTPSIIEAGTALLRAKNVRDGYLDLTEISHISEENHQKCKRRCNPEEGDILLVCVGATIGRVAIVPKMGEFSLVRSVALLKPNYDKTTSQYLFWCLKTNAIQSRLLASRNITARAGLYLDKLKKVKLPLPSLLLQKRFTRIAESIEALRQKQMQSQKEANTLFNALIQKAFRGGLTS